MVDARNPNLPHVDYGFIGIADPVGFSMAQHLRKKMPRTSRLIICEVDEAPVYRFMSDTWPKESVFATSSPKVVAENADLVITILPHSKDVKDVFLDSNEGLLSARVSRSILFIDCSTIDTLTSNEVNNCVTQAGHRFCDAPVSGGQQAAVAASLTFMIGGSRALFDEVRPLAEAMGKREKIYHCGIKPGAGLATKQINNYLGFVSMLGAAEAFNMGRLYGLDAKTLANVINVSSSTFFSQSMQLPAKGTKAAAEGNFEGGFSIELCRDVVEMALSLGDKMGAKNVLKDAVLKVLKEASEDPRCKGKDYRSIFLHIADVQQSQDSV